MIQFSKYFIVIASAVGLLATAWAGPSGGEVMPKAVDVRGKVRDPLGSEASRLNVFFFVRTDCPISNQYAPEMSRLQREFTGRGVAFWLVYPDADDTAAAIAKHRQEYGLATPALRDVEHRLVDFAGIRVTPEAALYAEGGRELYHGRIDNRYVDLGKARAEATVHDLEVALNEALEGKPIVTPTNEAVGCILEKPE